MSARAILNRAFPLIPTFGFTRQALAQAGTVKSPTASSCAPTSSNTADTSPNTGPVDDLRPLSETAISALFGNGDEASRTLIRAWLDEGIAQMAAYTSVSDTGTGQKTNEGLTGLLQMRLRYNTPVLLHLKDAFALFSTHGYPLPILDPRPIISHGARVANEACQHFADPVESWYRRRATVAAIYTTAELHQLASPETAEDFLDRMMVSSSNAEAFISDSFTFAESTVRSWAGIMKGRGFP